jgi:hypothetical protein
MRSGSQSLRSDSTLPEKVAVGPGWLVNAAIKTFESSRAASARATPVATRNVTAARAAKAMLLMARL